MEELEEEKIQEELEKGYSKAEKLLKDEEKTEEFLQKLERKLKTIPKVGENLATVPVFISMVRSYLKKEYTAVPLGTMIAIVSALIYVFTPLDLIADAIPIVGYLDDIALVEACLKLVKTDVDEYEKWRSERNYSK